MRRRLTQVGRIGILVLGLWLGGGLPVAGQIVIPGSGGSGGATTLDGLTDVTNPAPGLKRRGVQDPLGGSR